MPENLANDRETGKCQRIQQMMGKQENMEHLANDEETAKCQRIQQI